MTSAVQGTSGQMVSLFEIVRWVRVHGEVHAESRLRLRTLPLTVREGIALARVDPSTPASPQLLDAMIREAELVVGKPFQL